MLLWLKREVQKGKNMRLKSMLIAAVVLVGALAGTSNTGATKAGQSTKKFCNRCSPAFPGSIPHCGAAGGADGAGGSGGGGMGSGGG